jgi:hypothetical protein
VTAALVLPHFVPEFPAPEVGVVSIVVSFTVSLLIGLVATQRPGDRPDRALDAVRGFEAAYGAKFPKAVAKITDDVEVLLAVYDFPAEHWIHLRTTNPIVIWSRSTGVDDVVEEHLRFRVLPGGRGYLPPSSTRCPGRSDVRSAGGVARFAA